MGAWRFLRKAAGTLYGGAFRMHLRGLHGMKRMYGPAGQIWWAGVQPIFFWILWQIFSL